MEQGSAVDQIYIVAHGSLDEVVISLDGSEERVSTLEAECVFGEVAVLCSIPQPYTVRVCDLCKVLRIDKQAFFNIMRIYFADGRQVLNNLLKFKTDTRLHNLETDISFLIAEQEVELSLKVINAAYHGKASHVKSLIKSGADPNKADYDGRSPLHLAAGNGHEDIVQFLLQEGAEVDVEDKFGVTPLIEAVKGGHGSIAKILRTAGARLTDKNSGVRFRKAVLEGQLELVKSLLENGLDPNCRDHNGRTALHIAASEGLSMMARVLLQHGANIYAKDRWGKTPIHESNQFGARVFNDLFKEAAMKQGGNLLASRRTMSAENLAECGQDLLSFDVGENEAFADRGRQSNAEKDDPPADVKTKRRCTIFPCPPWTPREERRRGVVFWVPNTVDELLSIASQHFGHACKHVLNEDAGEILHTDFVRDSERIYIIGEY